MPRTQPQPILTLDALAESVAAAYGIEPADIVRLAGEFDGTFRMAAGDGQMYVVKVDASGAASRVAMQLDILAHIKARDPALPVARLVPSRTGERVTVAPMPTGNHLVHVLTWLDGTRLADAGRRSEELLQELGNHAARMVLALEGFAGNIPDATMLWDMRRAVETVSDGVGQIADVNDRAAVAAVMATYERSAAPRLAALPEALVHHDLNNFNLLVGRGVDGATHVTGLLDFGDAQVDVRIAELAVLTANVMLGARDPLQEARAVIAAYCALAPLTEGEVEAVIPMAGARVCMMASIWNRRAVQEPRNEYARSRADLAWPLLRRLAVLPAELLVATGRAAAGLDPWPARAGVLRWLAAQRPVPPIEGEFRMLDLGPSSDPGAEVPLPGDRQGIAIAHGAARLGRAARRADGDDEPETIALGLELRAPAGTAMRAPFGGVAEIAADGALLLRAAGDAAAACCVVFRGVVPVGPPRAVAAGDVIAHVAESSDDMPPALRVQVVCAPDAIAPEWARPSERDVWLALCPDPLPLLLDGERPEPSPALRVDGVLRVRENHFARSQRSYYRRPMNLVRGDGVWFTDEDGLQYLDAVNNVTHVGHGHPRVVDAVSRQLRRLNTNSRFVYAQLAEYADRLAAKLPAPLDVIFLVCTGSEANDLAVRIARQVTGRESMLVIDGAYHGNTAAITALSPNRYKGPGGSGTLTTTIEVPTPDRYRGPVSYESADPGSAYASLAETVITEAVSAGRAPAGLLAESLMGTAGQIVHPPGYLQRVFGAVRAAGGLCISDEVQVGFGRLSSDYFWGFQGHDVVPDIVTMGKPIGNGFPLAAVATTREIADAFDGGMRYFNTFGGNPVACAAGMAVLDVIEEEGLQQRAAVTGRSFRAALDELAGRHQIIGDVRGEGLYLGIDLVLDRDTRAPARAAAYAVTERMKDEGVIVYPNGILDNVLKVKPPLVFGEDHVDIFVSTLDRILTEGW